MLKPLQDNPHAPDRIAPKLFEKPSFALHVKALAGELFSDQQWADTYSEIGRTAHCPKVMTVALILQRHQNFSDRQMAHATRFDLEMKAALGLAWDDPGIPKRCFGDFRARLLTHGRECEAFNLFNQRLVSQGWIKPKEALIVDATHLEANATPHNPHQLIRKATQAVLRQVAKERPDRDQAFEERIALRTDTALSGGKDYYVLPEAERNERFGEAVAEARVVIADLKRRRRLSSGLKAKVELLETIQEERATEDDAPVDPDDAPPNRTTSHRDPDARWGAKGRDKYFHGYKRTILTSRDHGFVANVDVVPGNASDSAPLASMLEDSEVVFGLVPGKVIGDAAYGSLRTHRQLKAMGIRRVASLKSAPNPKGRHSRDRFTYDEATKTLSCPGGAVTQDAYPSPDGEGLVYRFSLHQCAPCAVRDDCTRGDFRSIEVRQTVKDMAEVLDYAKRDDYRRDMRARPVIEGKHSELVRYHGGRRTPYVGLVRVFAGEIWHCLAVNLKRYFKLATPMPSPCPA